MDEAIKIVCAAHYHQCLWLSSTEKHPRLRVTFSTTGNFGDDTLPVVIFCGPMFGSRWLVQDFNHFICASRVRVICVDRPSMGGSTPVDISQRIPVWLETVPVLLQKLNIKHVHLLSHSAGTMYLLNTLYHHRDILYPHYPYAALLAPWVHNEHSNVTLMNIVSKIPNGMINNFSQLQKFVVSRVLPVTDFSGGALSWSGGALSAVTRLFQTAPAANVEVDDNAEVTPQEKYGVPHEVAQHLSKLQMKYCVTESWAAGDEDAILCLKKAGPGHWGICEDYPEYVRLLVELEQSRRNSIPDAPKLKMRVYLAESDMMIGKEGATYFKQCWARSGVSDTIDFQSHELPKTNHETIIVDTKRGGLKPVFEEISHRMQ
ncbi:hypothetical protein LTR62_003302 [Meristemomyces frigidus]|uniref:AB hydrolase-1 domain-containing protein n=1 Tax=Meristemomyces frigidus TaxID=1508187 RepID=A0AAN7YKT6_9PEZI|nr:hypothetical protein LTR62_003302 [Meristemomyces frigidus]